MKKSYRLVIYDIFENLGRIEELCISISFYFSKIYAIEKDLCKRSKYAHISKQIVFLIIQRSNTMTLEILHKIDLLEQNNVIKNEKLKHEIIEMHKILKIVEREYKNENYNGMIKQLEVIGNKCREIREEFKRKV